ncbi:hypothetical protein I302_103121 [Kwoniella bestiolae CBS 10118]|uniref:Aldose 1-epimerase n=1 Tax=Kwoniella bestiolae CBS 10118 TaxID=1296100 RepID=A0A1B9GGY1_9TREE|nr:hypothetical protein I302_01821 [Kwoniella bestiolae CBS 10118]OCF30302.1 hypothetical protein I302_01821 [Kwoniella bestiolae CBS 10118]
MRFSTTLFGLVATIATLVFANNDNLQPYTIYAYGINATFIPYGARVTSLYVHDRNNTPRDVVLGYDDPAQYVNDTATNHTYFGPIVGRYANRIKNGTFTIGDTDYHVPTNEHGGANTLHGGSMGYDDRNWTVTQYNTSSITFTLLDPSGSQGFPGAVLTHVTYTVISPPRLTTRIVSVSLDTYTPIMLSTHIYWNLGAFQSPTILNDTLHMPYSDRIIDIDPILVPTGELSSVKLPWQSPAVPLNFTEPKQIYEAALHSQQCGEGCTGIDNAFILDRRPYSSAEDASAPVLQWTSADTGITLTLRTNQQSLQLYSCVGQNGTIPVKASQGDGFVEKYGCLVIEPQQWIDGINHPEWGQTDRQIFGPDSPPQVLWATYDFSVQ